MDDRLVSAPNLSAAWVSALAAVRPLPKNKAMHFVVRIADPTVEVLEIRALADELLLLGERQDVETVRNTIFPAVWAKRYPDPDRLANHYLAYYPRLRKLSPKKNGRGTYFGRIVDYPTDGGGFDQLTDLVEKLRAERRRHLSSRYEINIWVPGDLPSGMGFPCMSHMSFHLDDGHLFLQAIYRNQFLVERAYGNYLGLAQLQTYVARAAGLDVGELMVTAGHVEVDTPGAVTIGAVKRVIEQAASTFLSQD